MPRFLRHTVLLASLLSVTSFAQVIDPQNVLVRNVNLANVGSNVEQVSVSILVRDNLLELVSNEAVPTPEGIIAIDAQGGFVLGKLEIGEQPSFLILDADPRENVEVLLDTRAHTVFALHNGELLRNSLGYVSDALEEEQEEVRQPRWLAYTPPPLALPLEYGDPTKWNQWETENTTGIFTAAAVLDRQNWQSQNGQSEQQVGSLDEFDGGEIRGLRVGAVGTLNYFERPWVYTVFGATNAFDKGFEVEDIDSFTWFDYRLDVPFSNGTTLSVGKQKEPISMERVMSMVQLPMQERSSVSDAFLPSRNFGAVLSGGAFNQRMSWASGVFNNFIDGEGSISDNATAIVGRATWVAWASQGDSQLVHLGLGGRFSNGKSGVRFSTEPEFNKAPSFVDTAFDVGVIDSDDINQLNLEASWRAGPYWVVAEWIDTSVDSPTFGELDFSGFHIAGSWILTGESRDYRRRNGIFGPVPIARTVNQGGWGAWEVGLRYSTIDLTDGLIDGGEMDIWSLGLNWWLTPVFNINMNYRDISTDRIGLNGEAAGFMGRVVLILE